MLPGHVQSLFEWIANKHDRRSLEMFGEAFWKQTMIVFTRLSMESSATLCQLDCLQYMLFARAKQSPFRRIASHWRV